MSHRTVRMEAAVLLFAVALASGGPLFAQDGATVFKTKCAPCHGADATGSTPAGKSMKLRDLTSADVQKQTDEQLTAIITGGKSPMPAYKDKLTGDQITQVVAYLRTLAKK